MTSATRNGVFLGTARRLWGQRSLVLCIGLSVLCADTVAQAQTSPRPAPNANAPVIKNVPNVGPGRALPPLPGAPALATPDMPFGLPGVGYNAWSITDWRWQPLTLPLARGRNIQNLRIVVAPSDPDVLFAWEMEGQLFASRDGGMTWNGIILDSRIMKVNGRVTGYATLGAIRSVAIDAADPQFVMVQHRDELWLSSDGGNNWEPIISPALAGPPSLVKMPKLAGAPPVLRVERIFADPFRADEFYLAVRIPGERGIRLAYSPDGGENWPVVSPPSERVIDSVQTVPGAAGRVFVRFGDELWRSDNYGLASRLVNKATGGLVRPRLLVDGRQPGVMYMHHAAGIMRSSDGGDNWEDSTRRDDWNIMALLPDGSGLAAARVDYRVAARNAAGLLLTRPDRHDWLMQAWPGRADFVQSFVQSPAHPDVLYAVANNALWRLTAAGERAAEPVPGEDLRTESGQAVARFNAFRAIVGLAPLYNAPELAAGAKLHAHYTVANRASPLLENLTPSEEAPDLPFFKGRTAAERLRAAGFAFGRSEVVSNIGDPQKAVDQWMNSVYQRILDPYARVAGFGSFTDEEATCSVTDFAAGDVPAGFWLAAAPLIFPPDGAREVPLAWRADEIPDSLPAGARRPVGYPITIHGVGGPLRIETATLVNGIGQPVRCHPNAAKDFYTVIPVEPLLPGTEYTLRITGSIGDKPFERTTRFTTQLNP